MIMKKHLVVLILLFTINVGARYKLTFQPNKKDSVDKITTEEYLLKISREQSVYINRNQWVYDSLLNNAKIYDYAKFLQLPKPSSSYRIVKIMQI